MEFRKKLPKFCADFLIKKEQCKILTFIRTIIQQTEKDSNELKIKQTFS